MIMYSLADFVSLSSYDYNESKNSIAKSIEQEVLLGKKLRKRKPRPREREYKIIDIYPKKSECSRTKRVYSTPSTAKKRAPKKCQARLLQLAVPSKRHLLDTWRKNAHILPNYAVDRLQQIVMDKIPIVPISDAVYCFQRQKRHSKKKSANKKEKNINPSRPIVVKGVSNYSEKFSFGILKKLSRPLQLILSPNLQRLSEVIYKEISEILPRRVKTIKAKQKHKAFQIDVSKKIAIWIDGILEDTREKILQNDLKDLEEQEGPVWDFLDYVVENVLDTCVPQTQYDDISLPFGILYETPSEDEESQVSDSSTENPDKTLQTNEMFISNDILDPLLDNITVDQNTIIGSTDIVTSILNDIQYSVDDNITTTDPTNIVTSILDDIQYSLDDQNIVSESINDGYNASILEPDENVDNINNIMSNENQALQGIKSADEFYDHLNIKNKIKEDPSQTLGEDGNITNKIPVPENESVADDKINNENIEDDVFQDSTDANTVFVNENAVNNNLEDHEDNGTDTEFDNLENTDYNTSEHVVNQKWKPLENTSYTGPDESTNKELVPYADFQIVPKITFSLPNLNLLNRVDEKWPDKSSIFKFNDSFSKRKSNLSLKSISEYDASMLTRHESDRNKNVQCEEILTNVTSFKKQDIACQTDESRIAELQLPTKSTEIDFDKEESDTTGQGKAKTIDDNKRRVRTKPGKQEGKSLSLKQKTEHVRTRPKPENEWKVNLKTAPPWVKIALSNSKDLPQSSKPGRLNEEDHIINRRKNIEKTLAELEMWMSWLHKIRRQINVLENSREACTCSKIAQIEWTQLKNQATVLNNMHSDIMRKINRLRRDLTCLSNNNCIEVASQRPCTCKVCYNKEMQKFMKTGLR